MRKILFLVVCMTMWTGAATAKDIYIAQNASGSVTGSDCADAVAWSAFSSSDNWVAGNTLHICGTYNVPVNGTAIAVQASGSAGNPITILFEPGASISSPAMSMGINVNYQNYITINGGPLVSGAINGTIQNTANGSGLANTLGTSQCIGNPGTNTTVEFVSCHNLYITQVTDTSGNDQVLGISVGSNGTITHCSFDHGDLGLAGTNASNVTISFNTTASTNHGITVGTSGGLVSNISIHDNDIGGGGNVYDGDPGAYHRDPIIVICETSPANINPCVSGLLIYNNYIHGVWSMEAPLSGTTADTFLDDYPTSQINAYVFNNVAANSDTDTGVNNSFVEGGHAGFIFNNTIAPASSAKGGGCIQFQNDANIAATIAENNVCNSVPSSINMGCIFPGGGTIDYNDYYGGTQWYAVPPACVPSGINSTLSGWKTTCSATGALGCDAHTITTSPDLTASFTLSAGSPAIGAGTNLTGLCSTVAALCTSAPQTFGYNGSCGTGCVARPSNGPWDLGAYESGGASVNQPNPPSSLVATVD